ncbi:MAG: HD-GYP domain-containing protein [Bdellovibrionales bacterium]|nr:HD-GYP domain-containing protein [Bdellovibrionales bacterium]
MPVVVLTVALAVFLVAHFARNYLSLSSSGVLLASTLAGFALVTEFMAFYAQGRRVTGSIALIPFASAALVAPDARGLALILTAQTISELLKRRRGLKLVFNVAQVTVGFGVGIVAFRSLGGETFLSLASLSFWKAAEITIAPTAALLACVILVNTLSLSAVVAAVSRQNVFRVWIDGNRATAAFSLFHVILTFYLTWLCVNLGLLGSLGMVIPLVAFRQLLRTTAELTTVTEELLDLMVAAIEARDPYTSGHSKRVSEASTIIAKALGLRPEKVERVKVAALLHDVGKIDQQFARVLAKEGRLTPEEWETMKRHPIRSAELVGMLSSLKDIIPDVKHHHENWDGTGYPEGLKGEAIPLASRIIMFADTLDAITTDRPYRKALSVEDARGEFLKFRGKQFDPMICDRVVSADVWAELYLAVEKEKQPEKVGVAAPVRSRAS